jgi:hypothetical protein
MFRRSPLVLLFVTMIFAALIGTSACGTGRASVTNTPVPPTITAQPQNQTIITGKTATLTVTATGQAPLSYQWYQGASGSGSPISGASSSSYTTPALTTTTSYWVQVINPVQSVNSNTVTITVTPPPTVSAVSPTAGALGGGTIITITGTGFSSGATVALGGAAATSVMVVNGSTITAVTPAHPAGTVSVVVTNTDTQSGSCNCYTYEPAPTVTSITPASGPTAGGTAITIAGTGFLTGATVMFGATPATGVTVVSGTLITAITPALPATTVPVTVTNTDGQMGLLNSGYTFVPPPAVSSVAPSSGALAGGTAVTLTGTGFQTGAKVSFGATAATGVTVVNSTAITATPPANTAGTVPVVVINPDGQSSIACNCYTYNPFPTVSSVSPSNGAQGGGANVTVSGTGFLNGAKVTFGGTAATGVTVVSGTTITVVTPPHVPATVDVVVTNFDTQSGTCSACYTFNTAPAVTSVTPPNGALAGGTAVTITGTGFLTGPTVTFGGTAATAVTFVNATTITATTPMHAAGTVNVVVTNTDGQSSGTCNCYTYDPFPTMSSVLPIGGTPSGGTAVTIAGTGFLQGAGVTFGGTAATGVTVVNATTITATTPAHAAGAVSVVVTNADGQSSAPCNCYTYEPAPTVSSVSPNTGPSAGGTAVTISGTGFLSGATVTFGGTAATGVMVVNATTITATTPANTPGLVAAVRVTNQDTQSGTCTGCYTYEGTVSSISPISVGAGTPGFELTVTGAGFTSSSVVNFNGSALTTTPVSATTLTAIVPSTDIMIANATGPPITVTGATGMVNLPIKGAVPLVWDTMTFTSAPPWTNTTPNTFNNGPVRLAFDFGDNSLFVAEQATGRIWHVTISGGVVTIPATPWATVPVYLNTSVNQDLGLMGMAIDPTNPPSNGVGPVYVFYTPNVATPTENLISTVTSGGVITPIVTGLPIDLTTAPQYLNGGMLAVHTDPISKVTYIYASTGGVESPASDSQIDDTTTTSYGKILRFDTGGIPATFAPATGFMGANYACGFRNTFGFAFHPSGAIYAGDNGNDNSAVTDFAWYDSLDRVPPGGGDEGYGIPPATGACPPPILSPLLGGHAAADSFEAQSRGPAGAIFYTGTRIPQLQNTFVVASNVRNTIYQYNVDEYNATQGTVLSSAEVTGPAPVATGAVALPGTATLPTDLVQGPDGCVYVTFLSDSTSGFFLYRLKDSGGTCQ